MCTRRISSRASAEVWRVHLAVEAPGATQRGSIVSTRLVVPMTISLRRGSSRPLATQLRDRARIAQRACCAAKRGAIASSSSRR